MATAKPRVGRPRTRAEGPGDYVGFRAPRELKERLEAAAVRSGRSLSTEAQIRLERSFEKQDLLGGALELAYGSRLAGILLLVAEMTSEVGRLAGFASGESLAAANNWFDDPFAYDQAVLAADLILNAFRPPGDRHLLQKSGKDEREKFSVGRSPASLAIDALLALRDPRGLQQPVIEGSDTPFAFIFWGSKMINSELKEKLTQLLEPLIDRIPHTVDGFLKDA